jgi:lipoprotein-releasing system permease protein
MLERLFVFRYLFIKARRSIVRTMAFLSVGGIGIGVLAMIVVLSVMGGFDEAIKTRILGAEPHLLVLGPNDDAAKQKVADVVKNRGQVFKFSKQDVIVRTVDGIFSGALAQGEEPGFLQSLGKKVRHSVNVTETPSGAIATSKHASEPIDFKLGPREIAIGVDLARSLGIFEGDEVTLVAPETLLLPQGELPIYQKVKVKALVRTDVPDIDAHSVFYDVDVGLRRLHEAASLETGIQAKLKNPDDAGDLADNLKKLKIGKVQTWQDLNAALFYSLKMEKTLMGIFLALTVLVSSFSIIAVLVLLVTEKQKDVGILKALGASAVTIRRIFMSIGLALGLIGIVGGTVFGLLICWILIKYPLIRLPDIYYDTSIPVRVNSGIVIGIVVLGTLLTLGGTVFPAWRISLYEPIKAIRHDDN